MFKKVISLCMVCAMVLACSVCAFADDPSIGYEGQVSEAVISVVIESPTGNKVFLNPYGLSVDITPDDNSDSATSNLTLYTAPTKVVNTGNTNIKVTPTATGKQNQTKTVTFTTAPFDTACGTAVAAKAVNTKSVFMYVKSGVCAITTDGSVDDVFTNVDTTIPAYDKDADILVKAGATAAKNGTVLCKIADQDGIAALTGTPGFDDYVALVKIADDYTAAGSGTAAVSPVMQFVVAGQANGNTTAAWAAADTVGVDITLAILPVA